MVPLPSGQDKSRRSVYLAEVLAESGPVILIPVYLTDRGHFRSNYRRVKSRPVAVRVLSKPRKIGQGR